MARSLALKIGSQTSDIKRTLKIFLMFKCSHKITTTGQKEKNGHGKQRCGHTEQTQPLNNTHKQVKSTPWPIVVELAYEIGESVSQRTDSQQKWNLHKQYDQRLHKTDDGENNDQVDVENVGHTKRNTDEDGEDGDPLAVHGEVLFSEICREAIEDIG